MTERQIEIADLYYQSKSIRFGEFLLSIHRDDPTIPPSPWYMHYPKPGESGSELLPQLYALVGAEFYDTCEANGIQPRHIAGLPRGAWPLGEALARHYDEYPANLVVFDKEEDSVNGTAFKLIRSNHKEGDELLPVEDHTSGGRNKRLFLPIAREAGFTVPRILTLVDRQQGAAQNLQAEGVELISVFTADDLLGYGLTAGYATQPQVDAARNYQAANQF